MNDDKFNEEENHTKRKHKYSQKTMMELAMVSQGLCAKCQSLLVEYKPSEEGRVITQNCELAHIYGLNEGAARYEDSKSEKFLNSYENIIVLFSNCHNIVDNDGTTVDELKKLKEIQEKNFFDSANNIENKTK